MEGLKSFGLRENIRGFPAFKMYANGEEVSCLYGNNETMLQTQIKFYLEHEELV